MQMIGELAREETVDHFLNKENELEGFLDDEGVWGE